MENALMSPSAENYLETIYELSVTTSSDIRMTDIALKMNVSKASVARALGTLKDRGYVEQHKYATLHLTERGIERAKEIRMRHNLLKRFLTELLGIDDETADRDACRMEHMVSPLTVEKLDQYIKRVLP